jgi:hypothetical protein
MTVLSKFETAKHLDCINVIHPFEHSHIGASLFAFRLVMRTSSKVYGLLYLVRLLIKRLIYQHKTI